MADNISVLIRGTLLQDADATELLGRVSSVNRFFIGSSNEIGAFESGVADASSAPSLPLFSVE